MNAAGRAVAAAILAALFGAAWAALFYAWHPTLRVEFDRDLPRNLSGVYGPERDAATGRTFAWTAGDVVLRLPGIDRRADWMLDLRLRGGRAAPARNPDITILVDGVLLTTAPTAPEFQDVQVSIPARPDRRGLVIGLQVSSTFVPGPSDPRSLGVMLDYVTLTPGRVVLVPRPALDAAALSAGAMGAAIALLGVTPGSAIGAAILMGAGDAAVVARGFGPFTDYPRVVTRLGFWIAIALAAAAFTAQYRRPLRNTARFAAAFSTSALFFKLLVLLHPDMPVGDGMFHAHRFQGVLAGNLYFTSIAPGGYSFPYPPGLYVFAAAFAGLVRRGAADMALLRIVVTSVDVAAGLLLYPLVVRNWGERIAAAIAVAIYHLMPLNFGVLATGNLTNAFAQSIALCALVLIGWPGAPQPVSPKPIGEGGKTALLTVAMLVAFLSHTGTLAILFAAAILTAALFLVRGGPTLRKAGWLIGLAAFTAAVIAIAVYYAHFIDTYRAEFARIGHETASAAPDVGGRTIGDRLRLVPYSIRIYIGVPVLLFAIVGGIQVALRRTGLSAVAPAKADLSAVASAKADRLALALGGWLLSCAAFLVLGVLTPVDMRYYLAALPALAIAAGHGAAWAWSEGWPQHRGLWRITAALFLAGTITTGFHAWWNVLG